MNKFGKDYRGERQPRRQESPRGGEERGRFREEELVPRPVNGKCNNLCPLFWCTKRAYQIRRDPKSGRKYVFCSWIGDECIGASCQYATCKSNYLLPDGSCGYLKQKSQATAEDKEIFEDLVKEDIDNKVKDFISKKLGKKKLDDLL
ncbi:MAG: hypothetical protein ACP5I2_05950 [Fervidicoccaceae archaeon]|uniref:Uncharacterized protein n=1 Tax=Fervidicoccus fontis TaxID=683846 RepID=A0A7C2UK70_9CREN|nr:MAG: hypothetical protein C0179_02355 [Fervidicoccus sp.]HEU97726.1 hypothetical protein [Fervidicoccus fontis]